MAGWGLLATTPATNPLAAESGVREHKFPTGAPTAASPGEFHAEPVGRVLNRLWAK